MKLWLVSFANRRFAAAQRCLIRSAQQFGFDRICAFDDCHLRHTDFYRQHATILSAPRGAGYWLWKPYYVAQVLADAAPDDVVAYCDSAIEFICDPRPLVEICREMPVQCFSKRTTTSTLSGPSVIASLACSAIRLPFIPHSK